MGGCILIQISRRWQRVYQVIKKRKRLQRAMDEQPGRALLQSRPPNGPHGEAEVVSVISPQENAKQTR